MLKIKDFEDYMIDEDGNIFSVRKNKHLKQYEDRNGYMYVTLCKNKYRKTIKVHRLVAETFLDNIDNLPCINHKDSNRKNNKVSNLEFCTHKQNTQWALKTGRFDNMKKINSKRMKENPLNGYIYANEVTKKKIAKYDKNNNFIEEYESISEASRKNNITITSISYSANGKRKTGGGFIWHFV